MKLEMDECSGFVIVLVAIVVGLTVFGTVGIYQRFVTQQSAFENGYEKHQVYGYTTNTDNSWKKVEK